MRFENNDKIILLREAWKRETVKSTDTKNETTGNLQTGAG